MIKENKLINDKKYIQSLMLYIIIFKIQYKSKTYCEFYENLLVKIDRVGDMVSQMNFSEENLILIRCLITGETSKYFKAKDYLGNSYLIVKNKITKSLSVGKDNTFHAYKEEKGLILKKTILYPLSNEEYIEIIGDRGAAGKTLKELGIKLDNL